uniref:ATP synthase complex subunit 8 n=1 Tax=Parum colligata TaxID=522860 RepID=A0A345WJ44_9NEOP|nr:ATP synthase F0 subunit 8 [Parum colligata]AXJ93087.1 ATP synthase F0 subunit 8 [Parum colligata]WMQ52825.1 ATP synthase F0 subunit 8 [Callambulyx tatarinovii]
MPQMMPINWIISLLFFILIFILFNIINYYIYFNFLTKKNNYNLKKNNFFWKW